MGSVTLNRASVTLVGVGTAEPIQATVLGTSGATLPSPSIAWTSSNDQVVTVAGVGAGGAVVTSRGPGTASVRATSGAASASLQVNVQAGINSVTVVPSSLALTFDDEPTGVLAVSITADPGIEASYSWTSNDQTVATVLAAGTGVSATVTAVSGGTATITVSAQTQFATVTTATVPVTSSAAVRAVIVNQATTDLGVGRSDHVTARVTGDPGFPRTVGWITRHPAVATVSADGQVLGLAVGNATLVATSTADPQLRDSMVVQVNATPYSRSDFVLAPAGAFDMGSPNFRGDQPVHRVTLTKAFLIQKTEVTQAQWVAVMGTNPSSFQSCGADCPVEQVTWDAALAFIDKLNAASPGITYRLPTEAEWEYAARAGSAADFHGQDQLVGWSNANSGGSPHPVAQLLPNAWGLYDVHGNVGEWVSGARSEYPDSPVVDPVGPDGPIAGIRGGSWENNTIDNRVSFRSGGAKGVPDNRTGLRLARTP